MRGIKPMKCNVICTFDKFDEDYEKQVFYDFNLLVVKEDKNLEEFITNETYKDLHFINRKHKNFASALLQGIKCSNFNYIITLVWVHVMVQ